MTVPVYIAESSPPHLRGQLVTVNTLFITGGQFTASLIDGAFSYLQQNGWRLETQETKHFKTSYTWRKLRNFLFLVIIIIIICEETHLPR